MYLVEMQRPFVPHSSVGWRQWQWRWVREWGHFLWDDGDDQDWNPQYPHSDPNQTGKFQALRHGGCSVPTDSWTFLTFLSCPWLLLELDCCPLPTQQAPGEVWGQPHNCSTDQAIDLFLQLRRIYHSSAAFRGDSSDSAKTFEGDEIRRNFNQFYRIDSKSRTLSRPSKLSAIERS